MLNSHDNFILVARPGPRILDGVIAVAAEMALADGQADTIEQESFTSFLRRTGILLAAGRGATLGRYNAEISRSAEKPALADRLRPLAGLQAARLIVYAASQVAAADGTIHPKELDLLRSVHDSLRLPFIQGQPI